MNIIKLFKVNQNLINLINKYNKFVIKPYIRELKIKTKDIRIILNRYNKLSKFSNYSISSSKIIYYNYLHPSNLGHHINTINDYCKILNWENYEMLYDHPSSIIYRYVYGI